MVENREINGTDEIGLVIPTPELVHPRYVAICQLGWAAAQFCRLWQCLLNYRKVSNIKRTKSQNLNVSRLIL